MTRWDDKAFAEGIAAYRAGLSIDANPYDHGTKVYDSWEEGWIKASNNK